VRGCGLPLQHDERVYVCARGHSYDIARSGYVNLLQPQDRRSLAAGDSKAVIEARARLLAAGVGGAVVDRVVHHVAALDLQEDSLVVDLGSGSGEALAALERARPIRAVGVDLSTAAAEHAARRYHNITWVVANADRRLPFVDRSVTLVLSLHGRRQPAECDRVLAPAGHLLVVIPAPDDLHELRALVQGENVDRARADTLLAEHESLFTLIEQFSVRERHALDRASLIDLLRGTYRGARASSAARVESLGMMEVTLASEAFLFASRGRALFQ
jgi:23S rRNA (guanine745-N1)-methyltransferase